MDQDSIKVLLKLSVVWHGNLVKNKVTFVYATKDPLILALDGLSEVPDSFHSKNRDGTDGFTAQAPYSAVKLGQVSDGRGPNCGYS